MTLQLVLGVRVWHVGLTSILFQTSLLVLSNLKNSKCLLTWDTVLNSWCESYLVFTNNYIGCQNLRRRISFNNFDSGLTISSLSFLFPPMSPSISGRHYFVSPVQVLKTSPRRLRKIQRYFEMLRPKIKKITLDHTPRVSDLNHRFKDKYRPYWHPP